MEAHRYFEYEAQLEKEKEKNKIPETMWYQYETDRQNFEFLNIGQLTPLKGPHHNTIISVENYIKKCKILYTNTNKDTFGKRCKDKKKEIIESLKLSLLKQASPAYVEKYMKSKEFEDIVNEKWEKATYKMFRQIYDTDELLRNNLLGLYKNRIAKAINKGLDLEDSYIVNFEFMPASLGFDVDCYKIVAKKVTD